MPGFLDAMRSGLIKQEEATKKASASSILLSRLILAARSNENDNKIIELLKSNKGMRFSNDRTPLEFFWNCSLHASRDEKDLKEMALLLMEHGDVTAEDLTSSSTYYASDYTFLSWFMKNKINIEERKKLLVKIFGFCKAIAQVTYTEHQLTLLHDLAILPVAETDKSLWDDIYKAGANIDAQDKYGHTPMHAAVCVSNAPMIKWLIEKQASSHIKNNKENSGCNALELAHKWKLDSGSSDSNEQLDQVVSLLEDNRKKLEAIEAKRLEAAIEAKKLEAAIEAKRIDTAIEAMNGSLKKLETAIDAMSSYGTHLKKEGSSKGDVAIDLAAVLKLKMQNFFVILNKKEATPKIFDDFKTQFLDSLHSEDEKMCQYRVKWSTICLNIAIAFTGIGALAIIAKLIHSKVTAGRPLFFCQQAQTTREENIKAIDAPCTNLKFYN